MDRDLANLYGIETKALNQAVKRDMKFKRTPFGVLLNFMLSARSELLLMLTSLSCDLMTIDLGYCDCRSPSISGCIMGYGHESMNTIIGQLVRLPVC